MLFKKFFPHISKTAHGKCIPRVNLNLLNLYHVLYPIQIYLEIKGYRKLKTTKAVCRCIDLILSRLFYAILFLSLIRKLTNFSFGLILKYDIFTKFYPFVVKYLKLIITLMYDTTQVLEYITVLTLIFDLSYVVYKLFIQKSYNILPIEEFNEAELVEDL